MCIYANIQFYFVCYMRCGIFFGYVLHFIVAKFLMGYLLYFANICESAFTWLGFIHVESAFSHVKIMSSSISKRSFWKNFFISTRKNLGICWTIQWINC